MWKADKLGYRGNTNYNRAYEGDELVWEKQQPGPFPPDNEIWYTSTDGKIVEPRSFILGWPKIISNTYKNGKGVIKFASNITSVVDYAFFQRTSLTSIEIPNSVTSIGNYTFNSCSLTSVTIPDSAKSIGLSAFTYSNSLTSVAIPNSMTNIGLWAFAECKGLASISYMGTIAQYKAITKGYDWHLNVPATVVHCTDGDAPI